MSEHETITLVEIAVELRLTIEHVRRLSNTSCKSFPRLISKRRGCVPAAYSMGEFLAFKASRDCYAGKGIDKSLSLAFLTMKSVGISHE